MTKKTCVIYANCQGQGILYFLMRHRGFAEDFDAIHFSNFQLIRGKIPLPIEAIMRADLFIYQPLSEKYGFYATDNTKTLLKQTCTALSFPYIYNDALWPFAPSGNGLKGGEILMGLRAKGYSVKGIIDAFCTLSLDCEFERRFGRSISILKEHEYKTDVKVAPFILENLSRKKLFLSQSHPTSHIFIECVNQILSMIGYDPLPLAVASSLNEVNFDQCWPTSPYEIAHYGFEYIEQEDPEWETFYAEAIEKFLMIEAGIKNQPA